MNATATTVDTAATATATAAATAAAPSTATATSATTAAAPSTATATASASLALRTKLRPTAPVLRAATAALWRPDALRERYVRYLAAMQPLVRASVPLLVRAAERCAAEPDDPAARRLAAYCLRHAEEERDHDAWLLDDLAAAGAGPAAVPHPIVVELAGAQYYRIEHEHPVTLLGYIAVLEGNAPGPRLADRLAEVTGLPSGAFRTLREHAELDGGHLDELYRVLDALAPTPAQRTAVSVSALHTADLLTRLFLSLAQDPGGNP
ncbi:iron-containing redox enzyme family protein [Streptomyces sp. SJL17-1]|uniref:iron-containing redox enzyme family protein n=1 Tax=Streptomyces sp. SJL17-1 TaxID=2967223 RepID=UPI00296632C7|nr:iron-containing redox enzyme family protein [Streptomyces sp. SJL17-1]